ncbi:hypothetical protein RI054_14g69650 [Pseudoscourfieldia marina]
MTTTGQQTAAAADATAATPTLADGNTPAADNTAALAGTAAPSEVPESHLNDGDDKDTADDKDTTEMDTDVVEETPPETATAATARAKAAMTAFQKAMRDFADGTAKCQSLVTSAPLGGARGQRPVRGATPAPLVHRHQRDGRTRQLLRRVAGRADGADERRGAGTYRPGRDGGAPSAPRGDSETEAHCAGVSRDHSSSRPRCSNALSLSLKIRARRHQIRQSN